jgi:hypothetical protein
MKCFEHLGTWLEKVDIQPNLRDCITEYTKWRGGILMSEVLRGMNLPYRPGFKE